MPQLQIDVGDPLHQKVDQSVAAISAANDPEEPTVMVRGTELVQMTERGALENFETDSMCDHLSSVAAFGKWGANEEWSSKDPPRHVANALLARDSGRYGDLPRVDRVVDVPVLDASGKLLTRRGHHPENRLYLRHADGLEDVAPPGDMTTEDVEHARDLLLGEYLGDFEFADEASRAHALGLLLLPFVREYIPGPTPLHVILAPDIGSGKTTLAQACLLPGCGMVAATPQTAQEEEWRKRITSALLGGRSAILLDNLSGELDSGSLAAALTSGTWSDRILGESREIHLPVRNIWAATGNNLGLSAEQVRRAVPVFLDPGETRPADRGRDAFRHPDLLGWAGRNRRELVRAALTLVDHWRLGPAVVEGGYLYVREEEAAPIRSRRTLGSFEGWAAVVGGVLEAAGVGGFLENRSRLGAEADAKGREDAEFMAAWHGLALEPMETADLAARFMSPDEATGPQIRRYLPNDLARCSREAELKAKLDYWVRGRAGVWRDGYKLEVDDRHRRRRWAVVKSARGAATPPVGTA